MAPHIPYRSTTALHFNEMTVRQDLILRTGSAVSDRICETSAASPFSALWSAVWTDTLENCASIMFCVIIICKNNGFVNTFYQYFV